MLTHVQSLRRGDFKLISNSDSSFVSYIRIGTNESILVVANLSGSPKNISLIVLKKLLKLGKKRDCEGIYG